MQTLRVLVPLTLPTAPQGPTIVQAQLDFVNGLESSSGEREVANLIKDWDIGIAIKESVGTAGKGAMFRRIVLKERIRDDGQMVGRLVTGPNLSQIMGLSKESSQLFRHLLP